MSSTLNNNLFSILNMKLLSERVQFILKDAKIDQTQLGDHAGASRSVVSQWLDGKIKSMSLKYALEIERKLGYNHIWLMINEGARKNPGDQSDKASSIAPKALSVVQKSDYFVDPAEFAKLVSLYGDSTPQGRLQIMDSAMLSEKIARLRRDVATND